MSTTTVHPFAREDAQVPVGRKYVHMQIGECHVTLDLPADCPTPCVRLDVFEEHTTAQERANAIRAFAATMDVHVYDGFWTAKNEPEMVHRPGAVAVCVFGSLSDPGEPDLFPSVEVSS